MTVLFSRFTALACFALAAVACTETVVPAAEEQTGQRRDAVVYGPDDRRDVFDHPDLRMRAIAEKSSVVLVVPKYIDETDPTNVKPSTETPTLGDYQKLCTTEPFRSDPAMGSCSGALIDDDLVLTAGHCVPTEQDCTDTRFVFQFQKTNATGALHAMTKDDVFRCVERVVFRYETSAVDGSVHDYAIVRLDRNATPRFVPTAVRHSTTTKIAVSSKIGIIGYGSGIPAKIDTGATVLDPGTDKIDFFLHTSDAYSGNSGSPVFDMATYEIAGILVRGTADDFVETNTGCFVNQACPAGGATENGCLGMSSDYAPKSVGVLCGDATLNGKHPKLCAPVPCGNGRCEASETTASCPADCTPAPPPSTPTVPDAAPNANETGSDAGAPSKNKKVPPRVSDDNAPASSSGCSASPSTSPSWPLVSAIAVVLLASRRRRSS